MVQRTLFCSDALIFLTPALLCNCRALVGAVDASGKSIFAGKRFTGFSNAEEEAVGRVKVTHGCRSDCFFFGLIACAQEIPFLLEDKITGLGGTYEKAPKLWAVSRFH